MRCIDSASTAPDGQEHLRHGHVDKASPWPHPHTYGALDHRGIAYGLTRFACLTFHGYNRERTCPPCLPDGEGLRTGESFALPHRSAVWELSPACRTEPGHRSGVRKASRAARSRVHRSTPAHPPVAALLPLGGALGWLPAVAPMVRKASREPKAGRGTSP